MADGPNKRGRSDRDRVNVHEDFEVGYWTEKWGVSAEELREAVKDVGVMAADVAKKLGK